jgi:hypothetical protein
MMKGGERNKSDVYYEQPMQKAAEWTTYVYQELSVYTYVRAVT